MPYEIDPNNRKCIRKADSKKRVGCTKGSVKKYLTVLRMNVNESQLDGEIIYEFQEGVDVTKWPAVSRALKNIYWNIKWPDDDDINQFPLMNRFKIFGLRIWYDSGKRHYVTQCVTSPQEYTNREYKNIKKGEELLTNFDQTSNLFDALNESEEFDWVGDIISNEISLNNPTILFNVIQDALKDSNFKIVKTK